MQCSPHLATIYSCGMCIKKKKAGRKVPRRTSEFFLLPAFYSCPSFFFFLEKQSTYNSHNNNNNNDNFGKKISMQKRMDERLCNISLYFFKNLLQDLL